jgi:integrase
VTIGGDAYLATARKRGNSYEITVSAGYGADGQQIRKYFTWTPPEAMTEKQIEKELERQKVLFEQRVKTGQHIDAGIRFAEYADLWMKRGQENAERPMAPKTYDRYMVLLKRINAALGNVKLADLQPHHIREFLNNLREPGIKDKVVYAPEPSLLEKVAAGGLTIRKFAATAGVSADTVSRACRGQNIIKGPAEKISKALGIKLKEVFTPTGEQDRLAERTVLHHYRLLSAILTSAVVDDSILPANPAKRVRPPKAKKLEAVALDEAQAGRLLELIESEPMEYKTAVRLLLYTGMRRGEALGLKWADVDLDNAVLHVRRASLYTPSKGVFEGAPKTQSSARSMKIPAVAVAALREYRAWQLEERLLKANLWEDQDWIFTTWNGGPIHPDTLSGWFYSFIRKTDLPHIHIHSLRHTNASLLIAGGENIKTISKRLGHSQVSTTANIYSHAIESADAKAAQLLEHIFTPEALKKK